VRRQLELLPAIPITVFPHDIPPLIVDNAEAALRPIIGDRRIINIGEGVYGPEVLGWPREPLILHNPSRLVIVGLLREVDNTSSAHPFCFIDYRLPPPGEEWNADDWARLNIYHVHVSDYGEAKCMLEFDIRGSPR
jgi:hypothetical protein